MRRRTKIIKEGSYRDKTAFLLWPKTLLINAYSRPNEDDFKETRWLERATWRQRYETNQRNSLYWDDLFWIEDEEE